ncbi:hypothetical protein BUE76_06690 [Cnuella takakiae]|nr:hypothetical protein BUE76_06690 [Cnuella takakiae]
MVFLVFGFWFFVFGCLLQYGFKLLYTSLLRCRNPKLQTLNPKPYLQPETKNQKQETFNPNPPLFLNLSLISYSEPWEVYI